MQADGPFKVTIVNRQYHKGRHMVNSMEIAQKMEEMPQVQSTRSGRSISSAIRLTKFVN